LLHENVEYHHLLKDDLFEILKGEWAKEFNALLIGRDVDYAGRLNAFFLKEFAWIGYDQFDTGKCFSSRSSNSTETSIDTFVRLSPENVEDYSFPQNSIISKQQAWSIVREYIASLWLVGLSE